MSSETRGVRSDLLAQLTAYTALYINKRSASNKPLQSRACRAGCCISVGRRPESDISTTIHDIKTSTYHYSRQETPNDQTKQRLYKSRAEGMLGKPVPRSLSKVKPNLSSNEAFSILIHTRGFIAYPCWREQDSHRKFQDTVLLFDVIDGKFLLDVCTNCKWHGDSSTQDRRCTAVPKFPTLLPRHPDPTALTAYGRDSTSITVYWPSPASNENGQLWVPAVSHNYELEGLPNPSLMFLTSKYDIQLAEVKIEIVEQQTPAAQVAVVADHTPFLPLAELAFQDQIAATASLMSDLQQLFISIGQTYSSSVSQLQALRIIEYLGEDGCFVCSEDYDANHMQVRSAGCRHVLGRDCYQTWILDKFRMEQIPSCPACRTLVIALVPIISNAAEHARTKLRITIYRECFTAINAKWLALEKLSQQTSKNVFAQTLRTCQKQALQLLTILEKFWLSESSKEQSMCLNQAWSLSKETQALVQANGSWHVHLNHMMPLLTRPKVMPDSFVAMGNFSSIFKTLIHMIRQGLDPYPVLQKAGVKRDIHSAPTKPHHVIWSRQDLAAVIAPKAVKSNNFIRKRLNTGGLSKKTLASANTTGTWQEPPQIGDMPTGRKYVDPHQVGDMPWSTAAQIGGYIHTSYRTEM